MQRLSQVQPMIEMLEGRQLFAAVPDLTGSFTGLINIRQFVTSSSVPSKVDFTIRVAEQSADGHVTGSVIINGIGTFDFTGTVGRERFTLVLQDSAHGVVKGTIRQNGDLLQGTVKESINSTNAVGAFRVGVNGVPVTPTGSTVFFTGPPLGFGFGSGFGQGLVTNGLFTGGFSSVISLPTGSVFSSGSQTDTGAFSNSSIGSIFTPFSPTSSISPTPSTFGAGTGGLFNTNSTLFTTNTSGFTASFGF